MANIQKRTTVDMPEDERKIFDKLNKWLSDTESHPSETKYREESLEDYQFYAGDQDSDDVLADILLWLGSVLEN